MKRLSFKSILRTTIALISVTNFVTAVQGFVDSHLLMKKLYSNSMSLDLTARLFGTWSLMLSMLRFSSAVDLENKSLYHLTFSSFLINLLHFSMELTVYGTTTLTQGVLSQIIISGVAALGMLIGYWTVFKEPTPEEFDEFKNFRPHLKRRKES